MQGFIYCLEGGAHMKMSSRALTLMITALFLGSIMTSLTSGMNQKQEQELDDLAVVSEATSPGHNVFLQYISSDNCYYCYTSGGGSESADNLKQTNPDEFVYITYQSAQFSSTNDARSGNVAPIYAMDHLGESGGAPTGYLGDSDPARGGCYQNSQGNCNGQAFDPIFSQGGYMASTINDYRITISQSLNPSNSANIDITMEASFIGSGSAPSSTVLYAAVTEEKCAYTYSDGSYGHNCWRGWLLDSNSYATTSGVSGSGTGFVNMDLSLGVHSETWTIPASLIRARASQSGIDNLLSIGAIYSSWSTSAHNADIFAVTDSSMGPKLDLAMSNPVVSNPSSSNGGFMIGDTVTIDVTATNVGDIDYSDGGTIEFFYKDGVTEVPISTTALNNLNAQSTQTAQTVFDTSGISTSEKTKFGARLTGLVGDLLSSNDVAIQEVHQDVPPITKNPAITGDQLIDRNTFAVILAKADPVDELDSAATMTFNVQISSAGLNDFTLWNSQISGGQNVVYSGSVNEGREYIVTPSPAMPAGWYDVRSQAVDSRGQTGAWMTLEEGFQLQNGVPKIVSEPIESVMCDTNETISMVGHISDPETDLKDLIITSDDPSFIAWHQDTLKIEVNFRYSELSGCPLGPRGIELQIDDGGDYSEGALPYGTFNLRVVENGQPRWGAIPSQTVVEGGSGLLALIEHITDTDDNGVDVGVDDMTFSMIDNSNDSRINATLSGKILSFKTFDDDVNGQVTITLRASDGEKSSDTSLVINIQPVNDAPRIAPFDDLEFIKLKRNEQNVTMLGSRISDYDSIGTLTFVTVSSSEPGAAIYDPLSQSLTLSFQNTGMQTVSITVIDKTDSQTYVMNVEVYDALPFLLSLKDDGTGYMFVELQDTYIDQIPTVMMKLTDAAPEFTSINATWNVCSALTGTCDGLLEYSLDISMSSSGWKTELLIPSAISDGLAREDGSRFSDYYELSISAIDVSESYRTFSKVKWNITESMPAIEDMADDMFSDYLEDLTVERAELKAQIASAEAEDDTTALEIKLAEVDEVLDLACNDPRATCVEETQSNSIINTESNEMNMTLVAIIAGAVLIGLLLTLMISRRGRVEENLDAWNDTAWDPNAVPAHDSVANSMYGGAGNIFQQPVAIPAEPQLSGPPLPPGGLPAGWTAEQWSYYGQQYLDGTL